MAASPSGANSQCGRSKVVELIGDIGATAHGCSRVVIWAATAFVHQAILALVFYDPAICFNEHLGPGQGPLRLHVADVWKHADGSEDRYTDAIELGALLAGRAKLPASLACDVRAGSNGELYCPQPFAAPADFYPHLSALYAALHRRPLRPAAHLLRHTGLPLADLALPLPAEDLRVGPPRDPGSVLGQAVAPPPPPHPQLTPGAALQAACMFLEGRLRPELVAVTRGLGLQPQAGPGAGAAAEEEVQCLGRQGARGAEPRPPRSFTRREAEPLRWWRRAGGLLAAAALGAGAAVLGAPRLRRALGRRAE